MKQRLKLLMAAALASATLFAGNVLAQPKKPPPPAAGKGKEPVVEELGGEEDTTPPPTTGGEKTEGTGKAGGAEENFICIENPDACNQEKLIKEYSEKELQDAQIYAVQRIYALRKGRVELTP